MRTYSDPELVLAGETQDLILGFYGIGNDLNNEVMAADMEFAEDSATVLG